MMTGADNELSRPARIPQDSWYEGYPIDHRLAMGETRFEFKIPLRISGMRLNCSKMISK